MMKITLLAILCTMALVEANLILPAGPIRQIHSQDFLGQYHYGYTDGLSTKQEIRGVDGTTRGAYSYVDANGKIQTVDYIADPLNGFRVTGTNLPKPVPTEKPTILETVKDTPEVAAAKKEHEKAVDDVRKGIFPAPLPIQNVAILEQPKPVTDTPEVVKAKEEHFAAKKQAELLAKQPELLVRQPFVPAILPLSTPFIRPIELAGLNGLTSFSPLLVYNSTFPTFNYAIPSQRIAPTTPLYIF